MSESLGGDGYAKLAQSIVSALREYEEADRLQIVPVIHGDTVFSNGILKDENTVTFLDMRGMLGSKLTLAGDLTYDLAKTYQVCRCAYTRNVQSACTLYMHTAIAHTTVLYALSHTRSFSPLSHPSSLFLATTSCYWMCLWMRM
jgi:hypothetical protein